MSIGINDSLKSDRFAQYQNTNQRSVQNQGASLFDRVGGATVSDSQGRVGQSRLTAYEAYSSMRSSVSDKISVSSLGAQVYSNLDKVENDKYIISEYTEGGLKGYWCIYNKETGKTMSIDPRYASFQTDYETGKRYIVQSDMFGGFSNAWSVDESLENLLKEFMGADTIQTADINENYTLSQDSRTGIVTIERKGAEGNGAVMLIENEEQERKLEALAEDWMKNYPDHVSSMDAARILALTEISGQVIRDQNGWLTIGVGGMVYTNAKDPSKDWGVTYSGNDSTICSKLKEALTNDAITGDQIGNYEKWVEWLTEKKIDFELTTTEEDLERLRKENYSEWLRITSSLSNNN